MDSHLGDRDLWHRANKTLLTGEELLSERGESPLEALFAIPNHQVVEATRKCIRGWWPRTIEGFNP